MSSKKKKGKKNKGSRQIGSIPDRFLDRLRQMFGEHGAANICKTFVEKPTTFRVNTIKATREQVVEELRRLGFTFKQVPWYKDAFILQNKSKRELVDSEPYTSGKLYVQSLASMVPPLVLDPHPGEKVLDLTAAPGSKTSQIAAIMNKTGMLVANDNNKVRFFKLKHNMEHLGVVEEHNEEVDERDWKFVLRMEHGAALCKEYDGFFDKILLDAPCSAEARFVESNPRTFGYWSERKIKETAFKQRKLLFGAWNALKPGGVLVYSTCTFAPEENEVLISWLLDKLAESGELLQVSVVGLERAPILSQWKGKSIDASVQKSLRVMPGRDVEGFFVAKLRKKT